MIIFAELIVFLALSNALSPFKTLMPAFTWELFKTWEDGISPVANIDGIYVEFLTQPQPVINGTNMFGLIAGNTDYVLIDITVVYNNEADDTLVQGAITDIVRKYHALLKSYGLLVELIYLNYAGISQDILDS